MNIISRFQKRFSSTDTTPRNSLDSPDAVKGASRGSKGHVRPEGHESDEPIRILRLRILTMVLVVSLGGLVFGFDTGQISGFLEMDDFKSRFADQQTDEGPAFSNVRSGTIVGLLSIGTLLGALIAAPIADKFGRRISIVFWNIIFCVGVVVQIQTQRQWYAIAIGRWVAGLGVGGLSVLTPMYQSETAPRQIRGAMVSCYQLFITLGIFLAYCINFGTEKREDSSEWRIPMGIGFLFPVVMAIGIMFLRESPRWDYRHGRIDRARTTIAKSYGVSETHWEVQHEMQEIKAKLEAENVGGAHPWYEVFTGPRMAYRTLLGISLQALQQLTGANYFFYYGTQIFASTGIDNSFVTSMILGGINFGTTFLALYVVEHFGRRKSLMTGGLWMFVCFMIFASVGHFVLDKNTPQNTPTAGTVMIVFAALFIFGYAATWGPIIWCIVGEIFPGRYRAKAMGLSTASNWTFNFLLSFFTPFITAKIDYAFGYVFAVCNLLGVVVVYCFVCESQGRSLEETDTMYILHVKPWESSKWEPPAEGLVTADNLNLTSGARGIRKTEGQGDRLERVGGPSDAVNAEKANMSGAM
ncbi:Hexose transporter 2 [Sphaceloma murrayae]|uniref:Hexose transporter 2 n=1 Tax=Sphaceloma murrayae TaxID=2082308 RepID=A0A2K1QWW1_9PEZI|nr:Hexose transporter 2 [Sphaceloma murrayae]